MVSSGVPVAEPPDQRAGLLQLNLRELRTVSERRHQQGGSSTR
jgi:hypothetical protein